MERVKLMNMCKIVDKKNQKVLVQERIKSWEGIAFPGGKVEEGESIVESVKREVFEETGLKVESLKICGIKDWYDYKEQERQLIFLFESDKYTGNLILETKEGKVYWISYNDLKYKKLALDFNNLLKVFENDTINELLYIDNKSANEGERWNLKLY